MRGTAAARLTALFYEARFSSHPLDRSQRDAAEQALDELAAALAQTETAETEAETSRGGRMTSTTGPQAEAAAQNAGNDWDAAEPSAPGAARRRNSSSRP